MRIVTVRRASHKELKSDRTNSVKEMTCHEGQGKTDWQLCSREEATGLKPVHGVAEGIALVLPLCRQDPLASWSHLPMTKLPGTPCHCLQISQVTLFSSGRDLALGFNLFSDRRQLSGLRERHREPGSGRGSDL